MKKSIVKWMSVMLAVFMMTTAAGCGGEKTQASQLGADEVQKQVAGEEIPDLSEHVKITYMTVGDKPANGKTEEVLQRVNEILTEKVNAELEIYYIGWTDYLTNYDLTLAQMDGTIDLTITGTDWLDAWPNAQKGAFLELTEDMLKTYAPQTYAQVPAEHWEGCKYKGNIYFLPEDQFTQWTNHGFIYRSDWAKEAGLENGVHSWDDMTVYLQYIKDHKTDVIPWDIAGNTQTANQLTDGWIQSHSEYVRIEGLETPLFYGSSKEKPYDLVSPFMEGQELIDYAINQKEWADVGFWKKDVLNTSAQTQEEFQQGQTGTHQHHTGTWLAMRGPMDVSQPGSDIEFFWFGEETKNLTKPSISHGAMAVSAASENPERALMVYDLLRNDEEIYRLFNYGIEGEQYIVTEDGKLDRPAGYTDEEYGICTNFWGGRNDALELPGVNEYTEGKETLYAEYDLYAGEYPYSVLVFDTSNIKAEMSNLASVYAEYIPRIAFGQMEDPETYVAEFREQLKLAGYDKAAEELQKQLDTLK